MEAPVALCEPGMGLRERALSGSFVGSPNLPASPNECGHSQTAPPSHSPLGLSMMEKMGWKPGQVRPYANMRPGRRHPRAKYP